MVTPARGFEEIHPGDLITSDFMNRLLERVQSLEGRIEKLEDDGTEQPTITITPTSVRPGDTISIIGAGFPRFTTVNRITLAGINVTPSPNLSTDASGRFQTTLRVPGVAPGTATVLATVGSQSATVAITVGGSGSESPGLLVTATPNIVGQPAEYNLTFVASREIPAVIGFILVTFGRGFQVPNTIDHNRVSISASMTSGLGLGRTIEGVNPGLVSVDFVGPRNDEPRLAFSVPNMNPGAFGELGLAAGAIVSVTIRSSAGLRNPSADGVHSIRLEARQSRNTPNVVDVSRNVLIVPAS